MSIHSDALTEGFRAQLSVRGVNVRVATGQWVGALVEMQEPDPGRFITGNEVRTAGTLHMLRVDISAASYTDITVGDLWEQSDGWRHRVTGVIDNPADIAIRYDVETSKLPAP